MTLFTCECKKTKGKLISILLPVLSIIFLWSLWNIHEPDADLLPIGCSYQTGTFCILNAVFLPLTIAVMASRQMDMENAGATYKLLYTLQPKASLFTCKFMLSAGSLLLFFAAEVLLSILECRLTGITERFPTAAYLQLAGCGFLVSLLLLILQLYFSLRFKNQLYPLFIGVLGSFVGLFSLFEPFAAPVFYLLPWRYFRICFSSYPAIDEVTDTLVLISAPFDTIGFFLLLIAIPLFFFAVRQAFLRKEV